MDKKIRRNEICIIGLPNCDYVFSSTRNCFIGYGFEESIFEKTILANLLKEKAIQVDEAGGVLAPAQNAFCVKICSKIITAQFCIILLNNDLKDENEIPNANVNMEYGLMLGFNKYIIPFQKEAQKLPFNVAGLDTIKYSKKDFEDKARKAIDQAINATRQDALKPIEFDQTIGAFLISKKMLMTVIDNPGDKSVFNLGAPLGFNLFNDFSGFEYVYLGNFSAFRAEIILWRVRMLDQIIQERFSSMDKKIKLGIISKPEINAAIEFLKKVQIWLIVTSDDEKNKIEKELLKKPLIRKIQVFSMNSIISEVKNLF